MSNELFTVIMTTCFSIALVFELLTHRALTKRIERLEELMRGTRK